MASLDTVKLATLRELVSSGALQGVSVAGQKGGYSVRVRYGKAVRLLAGKDGDPRLFATLDTAARTLRELGVAQFDVDATQFEPGRLRAARPEVADAMRLKHAAGEHEQWFRREVGKTLARVEDGSAEYIGHDALFDQLAAHASRASKPSR